MFVNKLRGCWFESHWFHICLVTYPTMKIFTFFVVSLVLLTVLINYSMMSSNLTFLKNNIRGLQSSKKKVRLMKYLKSKLMYSGVLCLQKKIVLKMKILEPKILMAHVFPHFSHGGSNSCSVLIKRLLCSLNRKQIVIDL